MQIIGNKTVLQEVADERARQDALWGGAAHDNAKPTTDFCEHIKDYAGMARASAREGTMLKTRRRLIQTAALAVAAVEALDRKRTEELEYGPTASPAALERS